MHIPDGFLDAKTTAIAAALSVTGLGVALRQARLRLPPWKAPLMGLSAAFIFAAQMLNFPVAAGTSGHLVGGVLAAVLLGPSAAIVVMASVLILQCIAFADGGLLALGANIFNMGIVSVGAGYFIYRGLARLFPGRRGRLVAVAVASWAATVLAAVVCSGELALSGAAEWGAVFPAMAGVHMLIGVGEAVITTLVVFAVEQSRPELLIETPTPPVARTGELILLGLLVTLGSAIFVSPFASPWPDGLDRVAESLGLKSSRTPPLLSAPLADYQAPYFSSPRAAVMIAGVIGTVIAFAVGLILARVLLPRPSQKRTAPPPTA